MSQAHIRPSALSWAPESHWHFRPAPPQPTVILPLPQPHSLTHEAFTPCLSRVAHWKWKAYDPGALSTHPCSVYPLRRARVPTSR